MQDSTLSVVPLSKPEAVRQAIAALGYRAELPEILDYVRTHFGIGEAEPAEAAAPPLVRATELTPEEKPAPAAETARPARRARGKDRPAGHDDSR